MVVISQNKNINISGPEFSLPSFLILAALISIGPFLLLNVIWLNLNSFVWTVLVLALLTLLLSVLWQSFLVSNSFLIPFPYCHFSPNGTFRPLLLFHPSLQFCEHFIWTWFFLILFLMFDFSSPSDYVSFLDFNQTNYSQANVWAMVQKYKHAKILDAQLIKKMCTLCTMKIFQSGGYRAQNKFVQDPVQQLYPLNIKQQAGAELCQTLYYCAKLRSVYQLIRSVYQ